MTRRKGEIDRGPLSRRWPHHVALPVEAMAIGTAVWVHRMRGDHAR